MQSRSSCLLEGLIADIAVLSFASSCPHFISGPVVQQTQERFESRQGSDPDDDGRIQLVLLEYRVTDKHLVVNSVSRL